MNRTVWMVLMGGACLAATSLEGQMTSFEERVLTWGPCEIPDREWDCFAVEDPRVLAAEMRAQAERGGLPRIMFTIAQYHRRYPREALDALADTLVEIAVDFAARGDSLGNRISRGASGVLVNSAVWDSSQSGGAPGGTAYEGAVERVVELAYRWPGGRPSLIRGIRRVIGDEEWLRHLRQFAVSSLTPGAYQAIGTLLFVRPEGVEILRELYEEDLVTEPTARYHLRDMGRNSGWREPPGPG